MKVVQAVFGVFHHFELAHQLQKHGHLRKIYSSWPWARLKREGLGKTSVGTFPLLHGTDQVLNRIGWNNRFISGQLNGLNTFAFDEWLARVMPNCDALIAISGAGLKAGRKIQDRGGKFICDRGSTHQRYQDELLSAEYRRFGVKIPKSTPYIDGREELIYERADAITVPSSVAARSFVKMGLPAKKIHIIPYGVRLDRFVKNGSAPRDTFEVLFAGQVSLRKGIPYLLAAFAQLNRQGKKLTVAGSMMDYMPAVLACLPTKDVDFIGAIPQAELIERMSRSHVMVLPSVEEGLALVQAQALACGLPVIATAATGAEDLFTNGVEGFIVSDRNVAELRNRLQRLADDDQLLGQMAAAGSDRMRTLRGWDVYGDRWDNLLHELTGCEVGPGECVSDK